MAKPSKISTEDFDRLLQEQIDDCTSDALLTIPGVYEIVSEYFNNAVLEAWEDEQAIEEDED